MLEAAFINYEAIGERVRHRRRVLRLTQEQVAERVEVSTSFIGHIERAEKKPSLETMTKLARALNISLDELVLGVKRDCERQDCPLYGDVAALLSAYGIEPAAR